MGYIEQHRQQWFVIRELTSREIKRKYARSKLGIVWSVLNPLLNMVVLSLVFSTLFARSIENYPIYYLCGNIVWSFFTGATNSGMSALVDNKQMLIKVKYPMQIFIHSRVYTAFVNFLYSLIAFGLVLAFFCVYSTQSERFSVTVSWHLVFFIVIIFFEVLFAMGLTYILATAYVFFGDIKYLYSVLLQLWMYLSALFYPVDQLAGFMRRVINCNPLYIYIHGLRTLVLENALPESTEVLKMAVCGVAMFIVGFVIYHSNTNKIMQKI